MTQGLCCCASPKIQSPPSSLSNHFLSPTPLSAALGAGLLAFECHFCVPALGRVPSAPCPVPDRHFVPCVPSLGPAPLAKPRGWREAGEKSSPLSISHVLLAGCGPSLPSLPCVRGSRLQTPAQQPEIDPKTQKEVFSPRSAQQGCRDFPVCGSGPSGSSKHPAEEGPGHLPAATRREGPGRLSRAMWIRARGQGESQGCVWCPPRSAVTFAACSARSRSSGWVS